MADAVCLSLFAPFPAGGARPCLRGGGGRALRGLHRLVGDDHCQAITARRPRRASSRHACPVPPAVGGGGKRALPIQPACFSEPSGIGRPSAACTIVTCATAVVAPSAPSTLVASAAAGVTAAAQAADSGSVRRASGSVLTAPSAVGGAGDGAIACRRGAGRLIASPSSGGDACCTAVAAIPSRAAACACNHDIHPRGAINQPLDGSAPPAGSALQLVTSEAAGASPPSSTILVTLVCDVCRPPPSPANHHSQPLPRRHCKGAVDVCTRTAHAPAVAACTTCPPQLHTERRGGGGYGVGLVR